MWIIFLILLVVILPTLVTMTFQIDAWPFESYPMFSRPSLSNRICVFRVAYEDKHGNLVWWKPHYYKLVQMFACEARTCIATGPYETRDRVRNLYRRIGHCLTNDLSARGALSICIVLRSCTRHPNGRLEMLDTVVGRFLLGEPMEYPS